MSFLKNIFCKKIRLVAAENTGATAIEYGLIAALIAIAAVGAMQGLGNSLQTTFNNTSSSMVNVSGSA